MIYKKFNYHQWVSHIPSLNFLPPEIINYDIHPFSQLYQTIENFLADSTFSSRGLMITCGNLINTTSLLVPLAIKYGYTYITTSMLLDNLTLVDEILSNETIILDELGTEVRGNEKAIHRIINNRYSTGKRIFLGKSINTLALNDRYGGAISSKIIPMIKLDISINAFSPFVTLIKPEEYDVTINWL
jgi:hypothetical protein